VLTVALALLAAAGNACASVLQRTANLREVAAHRSGWAGLADLPRQRLWLAGIGAVIVSFLLQAAALATGGLAEVQPLMSLELPMTLLLASRVLGHRLPPGSWVDILAMTGGMAVFLYSLHPMGRVTSAADATPWGWAAGVTGGVVLGLSAAGRLTRGSRRAAVFATAAGTSFALTAAFISGAVAPGVSWDLFLRWQTYLVAVAGLTAMLLLQAALQAGELVVVQPAVTLVDPAVAVLLGVLVFGESVRTGPWIVGELVGAAAVGWGAFRQSRSSVMTPGRRLHGRQGGPPSGGAATSFRPAGPEDSG
jgi:drug/metabolite transporter (DMT)-like permease